MGTRNYLFTNILLCSAEERKINYTFRFGKTWGWVYDDRILSEFKVNYSFKKENRLIFVHLFRSSFVLEPTVWTKTVKTLFLISKLFLSCLINFHIFKTVLCTYEWVERTWTHPHWHLWCNLPDRCHYEWDMAFKTEAHANVANDDVTIHYMMVQFGRKQQDITAAAWMNVIKQPGRANKTLCQ